MRRYQTKCLSTCFAIASGRVSVIFSLSFSAELTLFLMRIYLKHYHMSFNLCDEVALRGGKRQTWCTFLSFPYHPITLSCCNKLRQQVSCPTQLSKSDLDPSQQTASPGRKLQWRDPFIFCFFISNLTVLLNKLGFPAEMLTPGSKQCSECGAAFAGD